MTTESSTMFRPIFIVGNERSGTTMLAGLFDRHSRIAVSPETHLFYGLTAAQKANRHPGGHEELVDYLLARDRIADLELDREDLLARFREKTPDLRSLFHLVLEHYAERQGKLRVAEKSPHHLLHVPTILDWYPDAKVICIVRDGRDAVLSLLRVDWAHDDAWLHSVTWRHLAKLGLVYERNYPDRFVQVRFEELVKHPEQELTRLDAFVGLEFEPRQLDPAVTTGVVPEWEEDWKQKANEQLDPSRIEAWRRTASPDQVWTMNAVMSPYLKRLGYPEPGLAGCPLLRRIGKRVGALVYRLAYSRALHPLLRGLKTFLVRLGVPEDWRSVFHGNGKA